jgi:hypothetical protein
VTAEDHRFQANLSRNLDRVRTAVERRALAMLSTREKAR